MVLLYSCSFIYYAGYENLQVISYEVYLISISLEDLTKGLNKSEDDKEDIKIDDDGWDEGVFSLGSQALSDKKISGVIDQIESQNDDDQSGPDQGEEWNVSGNKEQSIGEESSTQNINGSSEESQVHSGGQSIAEKWEGEDSDWSGDQGSNDIISIVVDHIAQKEGEINVNENIQGSLSEEVSEEEDSQDNQNELDAVSQSESPLLINPVSVFLVHFSNVLM